MKTLLSILLSLSVLTPIKIDRYRNSTNNTGNSSYNNFVQCTYLYTVDSPSNEIGVSMAGWIGTTYEMPQVYKFTLKINFREPVHNATMLLSFTTPDTYSYTYNYIAENCFVTGTSGNITVTAYNTDFCLIEFYFSGHMLVEMYDYPISATTTWSLDPTENIWVQSGYNYFDLTGVRLDNVSLEPTQNYNTELNSIMSSVDGIEGLLSTIVTNTGYLSTISTNISNLNTILNNIYTLEQNNFNYQEWINGALLTESHKLNVGIFDINWNLYPASISSDGTLYGQYTITQYNPSTEDVYIILGLPRSVGDTQYYWIKYPLGVGTTEMAYYIYIYDLDSQYIYRYGLWTQRINGTSYFRWTTERLSLTNWTITTRTDYINNIYVTNSSITPEENLIDINKKLNSIITILGTTDLTQQDTQNKETVDNKFNQLIQDLTLPEIPNKPSKLPFIQHLFQVYGEIINIPGLDIFKWFMGMQAIVMLLGVILK